MREDKETPRFEPPPPVHEAWPHECDLVMKGGITSGVVYPSAVEAIAKRFVLRNLGGASAGAIAAAGAAAAQYRKNRLIRAGEQGAVLDEPFAEFAQMARDLGGDGVLLGLVRPQKITLPAWQSLRPLLLAKGWPRRLAGAMTCRVIVFLAICAFLLCFACVAGNRTSVLESVLAIVVITPLAVALHVIQAARCVRQNWMGLCNGMPDVGPEGLSMNHLNGNPEDSGVLVPWLYRHLQSLAGLPPSEPFTFGHLWGSPEAPALDAEHPSTPFALGSPEYLAFRNDQQHGREKRDIALELLTTDLTFGRPQRIPFADPLYARREDLVRLLPMEVVSWIEARSTQVRDDGDARFLLLPPAWDFPVILAVRLSLSFPILISVVPLFRWVGEGEAAKMVRCWFSDGGILSNFPIHLFDQLLPERPTFGINLRYDRGSKGASVVLPSAYASGDDASPPSDFGGERPPAFRDALFSLLNAWQSWQDNSQMRLPGFRDRIAHINLGEGLGGLNLNMTKGDVQALINVGTTAGTLICEQFASTAAGTSEKALETRWEAQRRMRYRCAVAMLERVTTRMSQVGGQYELLVQNESAIGDNRRCWSGREQILSAKELVEALCAQGERLARTTAEESRLEHGSPTPKLMLRVTADQHG